MRRNRKYGFTMAEVLIVVAIIAVLGGVAFVNVARYMRSMKKIEFDGYAKEIFIAAQNHLTMSASEGYLDRKNRGTEEPKTGEGSEDSEEGVYYFVVDQGSGLNDGDSLIGLMLPFGSVDGTILYGGSYIVRYHPDSAQVLDVFYWSETDSRYNHTYVATDYYNFKTINESVTAGSGEQIINVQNAMHVYNKKKRYNAWNRYIDWREQLANFLNHHKEHFPEANINCNLKRFNIYDV